jgi:hypothetical protein
MSSIRIKKIGGNQSELLLAYVGMIVVFVSVLFVMCTLLSINIFTFFRNIKYGYVFGIFGLIAVFTSNLCRKHILHLNKNGIAINNSNFKWEDVESIEVKPFSKEYRSVCLKFTKPHKNKLNKSRRHKYYLTNNDALTLLNFIKASTVNIPASVQSEDRLRNPGATIVQVISIVLVIDILVVTLHFLYRHLP